MRKEGSVIIKGSDLGTFDIEIILINPIKLGVFLGLFISFVFFVFPISFLFIDELKIGFGYIVSMVLSWGCSFYFIRKALWSWKGKEIYNIKEGSIQYYYDYWLYKDRIKQNKFKILNLGYIKLGEDSIYLWKESMKIDTDFECYFVLMVDDEPIISNVVICFKDTIREIDKLI